MGGGGEGEGGLVCVFGVCVACVCGMCGVCLVCVWCVMCVYECGACLVCVYVQGGGCVRCV